MVRPKNKSQLLKSIGFFTNQDAIKLGVSQPTLSRLLDKGEIIRISRNLYMHVKTNADLQTLDFVIAWRKFGKKSAVWGLSALFYHQLLDRPPVKIWIMVPSAINTTETKYRLLRLKEWCEAGITKKKNFQITNVERTIVESFKYEKIFGLEMAVNAARLAISTKVVTASQIYEMARELKCTKVILKYWDFLKSFEENV